MQLKRAFRLEDWQVSSDPAQRWKAEPSSVARAGARGLGNQTIAFAGAGGKTTSMFQLARELGGNVFVTATTHLGAWQVSLADQHVVAGRFDLAELLADSSEQVILITGRIAHDRTLPVPGEALDQLRALARQAEIPLLIEADGARQRPLKAPAAHEPAIPEFADCVVYVAGLSALGRPVSDAFVHRPRIFADLAGVAVGEEITPRVLVQVLCHAEGGLKGIPQDARRLALLTQADSAHLEAAALRMSPNLLTSFDAVAVSSFACTQPATDVAASPRDDPSAGPVRSVFERVAGIVLAAGESTRFGQPKQLLDWHGQSFVRTVSQTALLAGLDPVVVVTGSHANEVAAAMAGLEVSIVYNPNWSSGQASSVEAALSAIGWGRQPTSRIVPPIPAAALFLLADQPQVQPAVVRALVERHAAGLFPIVAPLLPEQRRGNPVLFDRSTAGALLSLRGDEGGRAVLPRFHLELVDWDDERLLWDVDSPDDYRRLLEADQR